MDAYTRLKNLVFRFSYLGTKTIEQNGTILIGPAPFVAPEAWLNSMFAPLSQEDINRIEKNLGKQIPKAYSAFLTSFSNGLDILCSTLYLYGLRYNYARNKIDVWQPYSILFNNQYERPANSNDEMFWIGGYNWDGSHIYINKNNEICYCSRYDANPLKKWPSLSEMLLSEIERLYLLCDEKGEQYDAKIPTIPILS